MKHRAMGHLFFALLGAWELMGCAHTRPKPQVVYTREGEERAYKRYEAHPEMDFFHRWVRKAYRTPSGGDFDFNREEQANIIQQWGKPEYIRKPYMSLQNEKIEEWVYVTNQTVFQFVDHAVVYEGPITDLEQLLIRKGYPNHSTILIGESGIERQSLVYGSFFPGRLETYNLTNGWIVHSQEGN